MQDTAGEARTSSQVMYSYGPPHMAKQKQDDQLEHTYSSYVRIRDVALKTSQRRWMIGRSGERGLGISVLAAWHDDDDDDRWTIIAFERSFRFHIFPFMSPQQATISKIVSKIINNQVNSILIEFFTCVSSVCSFMSKLSSVNTCN